jgi:glycerol-3-phosphate acyltransferase PlsY
LSWWFFLLGTYLLGSIPFGYLIGKSRAGVDVRTVGSGNVGATNVMRTVGRAPGMLVLLLDLAKGAIPVAIAIRMNAAPAVVGGVALVAVLGHVFSIFLGFRGGKGVATAIGAFLAIAPIPALTAISIFGAVLIWKRYVSLASVVAVATFPAILVLVNRTGWTDVIPTPIVLSATVAALVITVRHLGNIRRLLSGEETRLEDPMEVGLK